MPVTTTTNVLAGTKTYLAGNLEFSEDSLNWRDEVEGELSKINITCLSPIKVTFENQALETQADRARLKSLRQKGQWNEVASYMKEVIKKDLRLIDLSDFVIFNFEFDKPTFGTIHELVIAEQQRKPVFCTCRNLKAVPLWIMGLIEKKYFYKDISSIIEKIKRINSGEHLINSDRWRLLKGDLR